MKLYFISFFICGILPLYSQECNCPQDSMSGTQDGDRPQKVFLFENGKKIVLCGYEEIKNDTIYYSEFILHECGSKDPIDFWDATLTCNVFIEKDTLKIEDIRILPVGENRTFVPIKWSTEEIFYENSALTKDYSINRDIRSYTYDEIVQTLNEYSFALAEGLPDYSEEFITKLFMAAISGNREAEENFKNFSNTFPLDGALAETYKELHAMYEVWE